MACEFSRRGGVVKMQSKTVSPSSAANVSVKPDAGFTGLDEVTVNRVLLQEKTGAVSTTQQIFTPDSGFMGLSKVTIPAIKLESRTVQPSQSSTVYTPQSGFSGFSSVTVSAARLQSKTVTPMTVQQVVTADSGYFGLGSVTVAAAAAGSTQKFKEYVAAGTGAGELVISGAGSDFDVVSAAYIISLAKVRNEYEIICVCYRNTSDNYLFYVDNDTYIYRQQYCINRLTRNGDMVFKVVNNYPFTFAGGSNSYNVLVAGE